MDANTKVSQRDRQSKTHGQCVTDEALNEKEERQRKDREMPTEMMVWKFVCVSGVRQGAMDR